MVGMMNTESLTKFWPLISSVIQEFWNITESHIEDAAEVDLAHRRGGVAARRVDQVAVVFVRGEGRRAE